MVQEVSSKDKALQALGKPATLGPDLSLKEFSRSSNHWPSCSPSSLPKDVVKQALNVGIRADEEDRAGTYFQIDHSVISQAVRKGFEGKIEVMDTKEALGKYSWLKDYWWKLIDVDADKYTALAELEWDRGYFIRILKGQKVTLPFQACLFIHTDNLNQNVHNVIIAESDSEAQIITGCLSHPNVSRGLHVGITEFYIKRGAKLTFTMIHNWTQNFDVRPRSAILLEEDTTFISNYICLKPVRSLQTYPVAYCKGAGSKAVFNTILYGTGNSYLDVGAQVILQGEGSRGEVANRAIADGNAQIYSRGLLVGEHRHSKAHLECRGLLLSDKALIRAVPELLGKVNGTELTHEAAVGKIAEEQVQYLMARGFSEEEAKSLIVRGFMDVTIFGLPENLEKEVKRMVDAATQGAI